MTTKPFRHAIPLRTIVLTVLAVASLFASLVLLGCASDEAAVTGDVAAAQVLYDQGDFEAATAQLEGIIAADENDLEARRILALSYAAQGENEAAIEQYVFVIGADDQDHTSMYRVALLERLTGDADASVAHFEQAIVIQADTTYLDELARTLMQTGDFEQAAELWGQALEDESLTQENRVEILKLQADAYANARDYDAARVSLEKALALSPNDETVQALLAELEG